MKVLFLGTGGGRFVMTTQMRRTGGFIVQSGDTRIHVDPGPGAIVWLNRHRIRPRTLSAVLVSHNHTDHATDAPVVVEGMTGGGYSKKGVFAGSEHAVHGGERFVPVLSKYHAEMVDDVVTCSPGKTFSVGDVRVTCTPTWHDEETGVGFLFDDGERKLLYLSDTGFVEEAADYLEGADAVIINLISTHEEPFPHTNLHAAREFLKVHAPPIVILQHFGARILMKREQEVLARKLSDEFGTKVVAARDGDSFTVGDTQTTLF